jgi:biopolymer transport protein ExbB
METVIKIWLDGGWLMLPLALLGVAIYSSIFAVILYLGNILQKQSDPNEWAHWVDRPDEAQGSVGSMVVYAQQDCVTTTDVRRRVMELRQSLLAPVNRRLRLSMVLVSTAPLTGLLGTVTGMLSTFAGLGMSTAGNTVDLVAGGISEALITTQTGLVLAIPGLVLIQVARRRRQALESFLNQLEILTMQSFQRRTRLAS